MIFSPRIPTRRLAALCHRLGTALEAGIDVRKAWAGEADKAIGLVAQAKLRTVSEAVNRGESIREALAHTGDYFPTLFREMADVGDQTGHLDEALIQLAEHYDYQLKLTRIFLLAVTWPLVELGFAIVVVGFLIWILGFIGQSKESQFDILGLGLSANQSLLVYIASVTAAGLLLFFVILAIRRGLVWTRPIQRALIHVPVMGNALVSLALARLAWSLHLTLNSGMDVRRAVRLSIRSTRNARFTDGMESVDLVLASGDSLHQAFLQADVYPAVFLDSLHVGEQSGKLVDAMARMSRQYREQAQAAMKILGVFGFFIAFGIIALIIIAVIFRLFTIVYLGPINDVLDLMPH